MYSYFALKGPEKSVKYENAKKRQNVPPLFFTRDQFMYKKLNLPSLPDNIFNIFYYLTRHLSAYVAPK